MQELPPLDGLSHAEKDALIQGLWQELQTLRSEVEKLKQKRVKKTSRNSSLPPSKGFKIFPLPLPHSSPIGYWVEQLQTEG
jgi:transposase